MDSFEARGAGEWEEPDWVALELLRVVSQGVGARLLALCLGVRPARDTSGQARMGAVAGLLADVALGR